MSATPGATRELAGRFTSSGRPATAYRELGRTSLTVSAIGFGAYRVDDQVDDHRRALEAALAAGCNLLDTSTNYTDGGSERALGAVLAATAARGEIRPEAIVVVSKIGYVQGRNLELARERERSGSPFPQMVKVSPGCWHCIHPEFLDDQLGRSLDRLRRDRLEVCLLHNPEYFLDQAHRRGADPESAREEFYERILAAFVHFEKEVARGRIDWYGVSSNSFGAGPGDPEATSLGRMVETARAAAARVGADPDDHHFAVAQLPLNLYEHGPLTVAKEGPEGNRSTLEEAVRQRIGVLVNRPLNAFAGGELIRLADFRIAEPPLSFGEALRRVREREGEWSAAIRAARATPSGPDPGSLFRWGVDLAPAGGGLGGWERWQAIREQAILPRLHHAVAGLRAGLPAPERDRFEAWLEGYLPELGGLLAALDHLAAGESQRRSDQIAGRIDPRLPEEIRSESLSRKALHAVASLPGVTSVLNGMRQPRYVEDSLGALRWDPLPDAAALFGPA